MKKASLSTQLLVRDIEILQGNNILVIGAPDAEAIKQMKLQLSEAVITLLNFEYNLHIKLKAELGSAEGILFGSWHLPDKRHDSVVVYLPKSEPLINMVLSMVNVITAPGGNVYIVGQKNAGIKSQTKTIERYIGNVEFSDYARHSLLYQAVMARPSLNDNHLWKWAAEYTYELNNESLKIITLPGVFSYGKLDEGTRMLIEGLTVKENSKVLDWGCGCGIIGLVAKKIQTSSKVDMVDSNALALEATKMTMTINGLPTERIWASDVFSDVKDKYDLILSNPPFHSGIETDYDTVEKFISETKAHLHPKGRQRIVANAFLKYRPLIKKAFGNCEIVAENNAYKIYEAVNA